jgi:hypothetical protein
MEAKNKPCIHLIDIENLIGSGKVTKDQVKLARLQYTSTTGWSPCDVYCIATNPINRLAVIDGWGGAVYCFKSGKDGADLALIDLFQDLVGPEKFGKLTIGSGDAAFESTLQQAAEFGMAVKVVSKEKGCSQKLRKFNFQPLQEI